MGHYPTRGILVSMGRYCKSGVVGIMPLPIIKQKKKKNKDSAHWLVKQLTTPHWPPFDLLNVIIKTLVCKFSKNNAI
ncbi:hypothetical protein HanXRQr2_Chr06g0260501 [Helianthus annuus]|uniref:Uncharacterized protein n=1 Tax=Helianthus annuus TaxID=4232 RepID=A0A9K3ITA4_HELAN|nr:hypothetical protein HanXRQr2_Chr06g0260501 [Helianthus annuus]KAJ0915586.1 hypothetical protein HanPSC8_Chr06g0251491 [Helianthus annuus]